MVGLLRDTVGIVAGLAVLATVLFAAAQVRHLRQQRRDSAAIELMRIFQTSRFIEAFHALESVPAGTTAGELRAMGREYEEAALSTVNIYETVGLLVFRRAVSFDAVQQLCGGILLTSWARLEDWVSDTRTEQNSERFAEWFQWLVERVREREKSRPAEPAYREFKNWRPR